MNLIFVGLFTEGTTDVRFLHSIVERTLTSVAYECVGQFDIELRHVEIEKIGLGFEEQILKASKAGIDDFGMTILCVHADADGVDAQETYRNKINPMVDVLEQQDQNEYCKILVAIVPVHEIEAWMLADKALFKREINTKKTDSELGIARSPESIANPKEVIEKAIRIAREGLTKKRCNEFSISELYLPMGNVALEKLESLSSYRDFKENVRNAFRRLNLLHDQ